MISSVTRAELKGAIVFLIACLFATGAAAAGPSGELEVRATVVPNCRLTVAPLLFGDYDPLVRHESAPLDAESEIRLACTRDASATISLDHGQFALAGAGMRQLSSGIQQLGYELFQDSSRAVAWGEGEDAVRLTGPFAASSPATLTIYGRIPAGQQVFSGDYSDIVMARVDF